MLFGTNAIGFSQVGINTSSPAATLDVEGMAADDTVVDGVIAPRLSDD